MNSKNNKVPVPERAKPYFRAMTGIMFTGHWLTDQLTAVLKPFGLSEPQFNVLRLLAEADGSPLAQQDIQAGMLQPSSNVSRIIDKLLAKELVNRHINPENRRKMDITLTPEGRRFLKKVTKQVLLFHTSLKSNLSDKECLHIAELLNKFRGLQE